MKKKTKNNQSKNMDSVIGELVSLQRSCSFCSFVKNELKRNNYEKDEIPFEISNYGTLFYNLDKTSSDRKLVITTLGIYIYCTYRHLDGNHLSLVNIVNEMENLFFHENIKKFVLSIIKKCRVCYIINKSFITNERTRMKYSGG